MKVGRTIRYLRRRSGMTQRELAEDAGVSVAFISMLEADKTKASLSTLAAILDALGEPYSRFFASVEENQQVHYRPEERAVIYDEGGCRVELLKPGRSNDLIEPLLVHLGPRSAFQEVFQQDEGEECGFVIQGELQLQVGDSTYHLQEGDFFYFDSTREHTASNPGDRDTQVLWFSSPPSFGSPETDEG